MRECPRIDEGVVSCDHHNGSIGDAGPHDMLDKEPKTAS